MKTRLLGGIAALVVAIIGTVLLITYVQTADQRAMAGTETSEVFVVQKAIPAGTPVSELGDSVAKRPLPKSTLTEGTVNDLADLGHQNECSKLSVVMPSSPGSSSLKICCAS